MNWRDLRPAATLAAALLLGGCPAPTETQVRPLGIAAQSPATTADAEGKIEPISLTPVSGTDGYVVLAERINIYDDEDAVGCIAKAIASDAPTARALSADTVRDALFPWLEPGTKPHADEDILALAQQPLVQSKLRQLGVRYLVHVGGRRMDGEYRDSFACSGAACGSFATQQLGARLSASIFDLAEGKSLGGASATSTGRAVGVTIGILPIVFYPYTGSRVCTEVGTAIARAFAAGTTLTDPKAAAKP